MDATTLPSSVRARPVADFPRHANPALRYPLRLPAPCQPRSPHLRPSRSDFPSPASASAAQSRPDHPGLPISPRRATVSPLHRPLRLPTPVRPDTARIRTARLPRSSQPLTTRRSNSPPLPRPTALSLPMPAHLAPSRLPGPRHGYSRPLPPDYPPPPIPHPSPPAAPLPAPTSQPRSRSSPPCPRDLPARPSPCHCVPLPPTIQGDLT